ncbi:hypothetical protein [Novacetimonas hansenii]|uniref:Uncharacterized protein n=1 Tax=Novacetimonas hansenii ATCC 23769 TaxID=714995 RepID=D5QI41_NOVHA|nr:hypothetical protein [Novacetimonas hansenii]EFG83289.1 hypothetical protein GXY_14108 [Novacetimonas hansenii ATCC 23769]
MHDLLAGIALGGGGYALTRAMMARGMRWYRHGDGVSRASTAHGRDADAVVPASSTLMDRAAAASQVDPLATLPHMLDLLPGACIVFGPRGDLAHASTSARDMFGDTLGAIVRHPATQQVLEQLSTTAETTVTLDVPVRRVVRVLLRRIAPSAPGGAWGCRCPAGGSDGTGCAGPYARRFRRPCQP